MGIVDMAVCYKYSIVLNIFLALFASCAINSKVKSLMKIHLMVGFFILSLNLSFLMFILSIYRGIFTTQFNLEISNNVANRMFVEGIWNCSSMESTNSCQAAAATNINGLKLQFFIVGFLSFGLNFLIYILSYSCFVLDINERKKAPPKMQRNVHVGYDSTSLRKRRFIDGEIELNTREITHGIK
jgi:hypothetical protein